jgi:RsiW-degrading membrane proteinase PrsW (M82 family)
MDERATLGMALGMARGEAVLAALLWTSAAVLWFTNGVVDPEARLWAAFMIVQSLPFAAAVYVSMVNALEQMRHARTAYEAPPVASVSAPAMQPAQ